jgi:putative ABC transport system ATP-binding protein
MLELDEARKYYSSPGGAVHAVDGVSLTVVAGESIAILGPSGSGKTTLLLLTAGLVRADSGGVRFDGRDLGSLSKRAVLEYRRTKLGFVFQNFNLVAGLSAEENAALPLLLRGESRHAALERARRLLDEVGLLDRAAHTPDRLSGGEQQRLAIARALIGDPKLILADEPTGNLDTETGDAVLDLLSTLQHERQVAMILVTHDPRVTRCADRALVMRDGRLTSLDAEAEAAIAE